MARRTRLRGDVSIPASFLSRLGRSAKTAGLISAEARHEAARDAMALQAAGVVKLKTARYRHYQIERIIVPFAAEERLRALFSHVLPGPPEPKFDFGIR